MQFQELEGVSIDLSITSIRRAIEQHEEAVGYRPGFLLVSSQDFDRWYWMLAQPEHFGEWFGVIPVPCWPEGAFAVASSDLTVWSGGA